MMDAELGEGGRASAGSAAGVGTGAAVGTGTPAAPGAAPLPLPDAGALDWAALVHTATRAMLQVHVTQSQQMLYRLILLR